MLMLRFKLNCSDSLSYQITAFMSLKENLEL